MSTYQVGDRLKFIAPYNTYHIEAGDTAMIVGLQPAGWCVCFDRAVRGHDCDMPGVVPNGHGWWLLDDDLDLYTVVVANPADQIDISSLNLEDVL